MPKPGAVGLRALPTVAPVDQTAGLDAVDIGKTIYPHPTLGESIDMAAEVAHGSCTDLPPARK